MEINEYHKLTIELHGAEIDSFRILVRLAHERLKSSEKHQLRGVPLYRQAGLMGVDLFRLVGMLEELEARFGGGNDCISDGTQLPREY